MNHFAEFLRGPISSGLIVAFAATALWACGSDEAEIDEVPEVAEVRLEELYPLSPDDVGKVIMANGTVVGRAVPGGFFLRTEGAQVLFVRTPVPVSPGSVVRVVGPLQQATVAVFDEWEEDALEGEVEAEWDIQEGKRQMIVFGADFFLLLYLNGFRPARIRSSRKPLR